MYPKEQDRNQREEMISEMLHSLAIEMATADTKQVLELKRKIDVLEFERKILTDIAALEKLVVEE